MSLQISLVYLALKTQICLPPNFLFSIMLLAGKGKAAIT